MNFLSHLFISKALHHHLIKNMNLDKKAFMYGNIKPDLPSKCFGKPHILENYLATICENSNQLMNTKSSLKQYSSKLGEICHFICDFFCHYHFDKVIYKKSLHHFIYEIRLHLVLCKILFKQKLKQFPYVKKARKDISSIVLEMLKDYSSNPGSMKKDIYYAYSTALWVCESVLYFMVHSSDLPLGNKFNFYHLQSVEGGQL